MRQLWLPLFVLFVGLAASVPAQAQLPENDPFAALLTRRAPSAVQLSTGEPQLFQTTEGDETFLFQAQGNTALIRYLCNPARQASLECELLAGSPGEEIFSLTAKRSPRGDITYKDYQGVTVLRVTASGGATLFSPDLQDVEFDDEFLTNGKAVLPVVEAAPTLKAPPANRELVEERMRRANELLYQRRGLFITFFAPGQSARDNAVLADTVLTAAKALDIVADDPLGTKVLGERLKSVEIVRGKAADLSLEAQTLRVVYDPASDFKGRPSSVAIARFLEANL